MPKKKKKLVKATPPDDMDAEEKAEWNKERDRYEIFSDMYDDLPDGAYFAAMEEAGFGPEDIIEFCDKQVSA